MVLSLFEEFEQIFRRCRSGNHGERTQDVLERGERVEPVCSNEVFDVEHAGHMIKIAVDHRISAERRRGDEFGHIMRGCRSIDRDDVAPGDHDLFGRAVVEFEDVTDQVALQVAELTAACGFVGDDREFVAGVQRESLVWLGDAQQAHQCERDRVEHGDHRSEQHAERAHHRLESDAHRFGSLQRESLGDHLAQDDVEVGDDAEGDDESDGV